ncbi:DUF4360 domain-containing protein [Pseudobacteriovorax antillogorgiicola]|uniref:Uncharacterized protein n=1 Tax=Pseudobacteriovorax antillogorgiicola TaxID=1513793 RepID=A0A1Y6CKG5_9BACT|nr:DUF4360 domain-containing protein [Pseudobacteriovorax antillogorgiicola]TCS45915.1 uncharacterized protein DUF4360 [Pseudobacteriovorax antillogorgiicola]SMF71069.1 protein of unknown function [Pseudobacteriovorax antillogorgiicola]
MKIQCLIALGLFYQSQAFSQVSLGQDIRFGGTGCTSENAEVSLDQHSETVTVKVKLDAFSVKAEGMYQANTCNLVVPIINPDQKTLSINSIRVIGDASIAKKDAVAGLVQKAFFDLNQSLFFQNEIHAPYNGPFKFTSEFAPSKSAICQDKLLLNLDSILFSERNTTAIGVKEIIANLKLENQGC